MLKKFDLDPKYGPCYGMLFNIMKYLVLELISALFKLGVKRIDRWNWANSHQLNPSKKVKELVEKNLNDPNYTERYILLNYSINKVHFNLFIFIF